MTHVRQLFFYINKILILGTNDVLFMFSIFSIMSLSIFILFCRKYSHRELLLSFIFNCLLRLLRRNQEI